MTTSTSAEAGPSRRTPIRSLRQPALLKIATRNDAGGLEPPSHSDAVALRLAMDRKVQWRRKGERWMDRICEGTVGKEEFKRGVKYLEHHQYLESLHERHLNNLCSYPLCPHPPRAPYTSKPKWKITKSRAEVVQKEGNEEDGYCSKICKIRSGYVGDQMKEGAGLRGPKWEIELLEEVRPDIGNHYQTVESLGKDTAVGQGKTIGQSRPNGDGLKIGQTTPKLATKVDTPTLSGLSDRNTQSPQIDTRNTTKTPTSPPPQPKPLKRLPPKTAPPAPIQPPQPQSKLDELLASLTIIERPTQPPAAPLPPSTSPIKSTIPIPAAATSARGSSSLIATPVKLATTLITASRLTGPVPQLAEDSDSDSELSEWEVEMDGFGGLGDAEKRLFEEMREARDMIDENT